MNRATDKAFEKLVSQYADRLFNHALRMLGRREDAEEAVQDIFLKVHRGIAGFRGDSEIRAWLYRITVNTCLTRLRTRRAPDIHPDSAGSEDGNMWDMLATRDTGPAELLIEKDTRQLVLLALNSLPPHDREILILFHIDGLSYEEIVRALDVPLGTACARLYRARKKLKEIMGSLQNELRS